MVMSGWPIKLTNMGNESMMREGRSMFKNIVSLM